MTVTSKLACTTISFWRRRSVGSGIKPSSEQYPIHAFRKMRTIGLFVEWKAVLTPLRYMSRNIEIGRVRLRASVAMRDDVKKQPL